MEVLGVNLLKANYKYILQLQHTLKELLLKIKTVAQR